MIKNRESQEMSLRTPHMDSAGQELKTPLEKPLQSVRKDVAPYQRKETNTYSWLLSDSESEGEDKGLQTSIGNVNDRFSRASESSKANSQNERQHSTDGPALHVDSDPTSVRECRRPVRSHAGVMPSISKENGDQDRLPDHQAISSMAKFDPTSKWPARQDSLGNRVEGESSHGESTSIDAEYQPEIPLMSDWMRRSDRLENLLNELQERSEGQGT